MASPSINQGFMGSAIINGDNYRCTDFQISTGQELLFYNSVIGLNDTIPTTKATKGEDTGLYNVQHNIFRPGTIDVSGTISIIPEENNIQNVYNLARNGNPFDVTLIYFCSDGAGTGTSRSFIGCKMGNFSLSISASDILQISIGVTAVEASDDTSTLRITDSEKLLTWDKVSIAGSGADILQAFDLSVENPIIPVYTSSPGNAMSDFGVKELRIGTQNVTGSISGYNRPNLELLTAASAQSGLTLEIGSSFSETLEVVFLPNNPSGSVGPMVTTIPFVGVNNALGA